MYVRRGAGKFLFFYKFIHTHIHLYPAHTFSFLFFVFFCVQAYTHKTHIFHGSNPCVFLCSCFHDREYKKEGILTARTCLDYLTSFLSEVDLKITKTANVLFQLKKNSQPCFRTKLILFCFCCCFLSSRSNKKKKKNTYFYFQLCSRRMVLYSMKFNFNSPPYFPLPSFD